MPPQSELPTTPTATDTDDVVEDVTVTTFTGGSGVPIGYERIPGGQFFQTMDSWESPVYHGSEFLAIQNEGSPVRPINFEPINDMPTSSSHALPFTNEDIRAWADGRLCSVTAGRERHVIEALARIIVREVLR